MYEKLRVDLHNVFYSTCDTYDGFPEQVINISDVDLILDKHSYLKIGDLLKIIEPRRLIAISAATTLTNYDFLGTAAEAFNGGAKKALKSITDDPFEMNVAKVDVRDGLDVYLNDNGRIVNEQAIFMIVN